MRRRTDRAIACLADPAAGLSIAYVRGVRRSRWAALLAAYEPITSVQELTSRALALFMGAALAEHAAGVGGASSALVGHPLCAGDDLGVDVIPWVFAASGVAALLAALLPGALHRLPLSEPMVFLGAGVIGWLVFDGLFTPDPMVYGTATEHITEVCVIIALMGAGLAIDRPVSWRGWGTTWRLLGITMPLSIAAVALLGWWGLGFGPAAALLLGAALAPTDPVLASDVQVGEPSESPNDEDTVRFALTSEAGLNDGLGFPFTYAAIAIGLAGLPPSKWLFEWFAFDLAYRIGAGILVGVAVGWLLVQLIFRRGPGSTLAERGDGFVALAATFLAYGAAELVEGYGFIAVFACACAIRASEREHGYHGVLHGFIEQIERLITVVVLVLLGGAIARGLLEPLTLGDVAVALALIFVIRPVFGWLSLIGAPGTRRERAAIAFFGVRGVGSIYYLAYGIEHLGEFAEAERLWAIGGLVVLLSVVVHGFTAQPAMRHVDLKREEREGHERRHRRLGRPTPGGSHVVAPPPLA